MARIRFVIVAAALFIAIGGQKPIGQQPARDTRPIDRAGIGVIRGRVLGADTRVPLRHAFVSLEGPPRPSNSSTLTDLDGRFEFTQLPSGRYRLTAAKRGYLQLEYGQRHPRQQGTPINLPAAGVTEDVEFLLPPAGAISGTVTDDLGEPIERARVTVLQRQFSQGGRRLVPVGPASYLDTGYTNDLGQYRIYGLPPGTYYVGVKPPYSDTGTDDSFAFAPSYYPGTAEMAQAGRIALKIGEQRAGADVMVVAARPTRVSGIVFNSLGQPAAGASVGASQAVGDASTSTSYGRSRATTQADGRFVLAGLPPGTHTLSASLRDAATGDLERGQISVNVAGSPVDGVMLTTLAPVTVAGRVRIDRAATPPLPVLGRVIVSDARFEMPPYVALLQPDGSFTARGIMPGPARAFIVPDLPAGWGVESVRYQGRDITDGGIDVGANDLNGIDIVVSNRAASLNGTVTDSDGQVVSDYAVVVFSDIPARWAPGRSVVKARPDQNGGFSVSDLRPGTYFAVALEYLADGDEYDPEVLSSLREVAMRLTLGDGEKKTIQLRMITP